VQLDDALERASDLAGGALSQEPQLEQPVSSPQPDLMLKILAMRASS
jgi:hypothetical protein